MKKTIYKLFALTSENGRGIEECKEYHSLKAAEKAAKESVIKPVGFIRYKIIKYTK